VTIKSKNGSYNTFRIGFLEIGKSYQVNTFTQLPSTYYIFSPNIALMLALNPHQQHQ
jgi:hypothetical protein